MNNIFIVIYLIGVLVVIPLNISMLIEDKVNYKQLTLSRLLCALVVSLFSWVEILLVCDQIIIWKKKK